MPAKRINVLPRRELLTYEEITTIVRVAADMGITRIRLTGGEPLVRTRLPELIARLAAIETITDISLTTNGSLLKDYADELKQAGLKRVNVSLDSLDRDKFVRITRCHKLRKVLQGIEAAKVAGLNPVKINVVAMRGINDDEIINFAGMTVSGGWHVRFIELMPFGVNNPAEVCLRKDGENPQPQFISIDEIKERLSGMGELHPVESITGNGPAKYFQLPNATGTIGFISPVSQHFCFNCNRLRLTADGKLRPCLLSDEEIDLRKSLRDGASLKILRETIDEAVQKKPGQHHLSKGLLPSSRFMSQVGG
jgi:cyclic pyranopterin phosphate synthase